MRCECRGGNRQVFEAGICRAQRSAPRIVDLFQIARANFYHPAMGGSWSFRSVFNAVAPDLHADAFDCAGESATQAAFARTLQRGLDAGTRHRLGAALAAHGRRQTTALRRLVALFESAG